MDTEQGKSEPANCPPGRGDTLRFPPLDEGISRRQAIIDRLTGNRRTVKDGITKIERIKPSK